MFRVQLGTSRGSRWHLALMNCGRRHSLQERQIHHVKECCLCDVRELRGGIFEVFCAMKMARMYQPVTQSDSQERCFLFLFPQVLLKFLRAYSPPTAVRPSSTTLQDYLEVGHDAALGTSRSREWGGGHGRQRNSGAEPRSR